MHPASPKDIYIFEIKPHTCFFFTVFHLKYQPEKNTNNREPDRTKYTQKWFVVVLIYCISIKISTRENVNTRKPMGRSFIQKWFEFF